MLPNIQITLLTAFWLNTIKRRAVEKSNESANLQVPTVKVNSFFFVPTAHHADGMMGNKHSGLSNMTVKLVT